MGFFDTLDSENEREELGRSSFQLLHSLSFLQQSSNDTSRFVMYDLVNELAEWVAGEIYFRMEHSLAVDVQHRLSQCLRHLSYIPGEYDGGERLEAVCDVGHLRTFLPVMLSNIHGKFHYLAGIVLHKLFKLQALRVFSLHGYYVFELPNSIGDLKFLRYLNLSETKLKTLPESINTLYNLHTLMLEDCHRLRKLCADMGNLIKLHHLNNSNTNLLEEMPFGIGKLTCLQTLCNFSVGKDVGSGLQELKSLMHLRGTLTISRLENVRVVGDAKAAQLTEKKHLKVLLLQWTSSTSDDPREPETETKLLDMLKPHQNLEKFCISGYGGAKFPIWLGYSSFAKLVTLRFQSCSICTSLPSVGQLPSLKNLEVCGMSRIKSVGSEFYGNSCPITFPSLETLCFEDMIEWEEWNPHGTGQEVEGFPRLRELSLIDCFKLGGRLPECLPSLEKLVIKRCEQLVVSIPSLPKLCKLEIDGCKKVVWRSAIDSGLLDSVVCRNLSNQVFLEGPLKQQLPELEELKINNIEELTYLWQNETWLLQDISSLKRLKIESCPLLQSLVAEEKPDQQHLSLQCRLEYLEIVHCQGLVKLPQALFSLSSLREVKIWNCSSLVSLPKAWMHNSNPSLERLNIVRCHSLTSIQLPSSLKQLEIKHCDNLRTLIEEEDIHHRSIKRYTSLLEHLVIRWCPSLTSLFSTKELPATLEHLDVQYCSNLVFLSWSGNLPQALKYLYVSGCSKLESIAERLDKNTSLEIIRVCYCENLKLLPGGLHKLYHLQEICVSDCPMLVSFPEGVLPSKKLTKLEIAGCEKLVALPNGMHNLASLRKLEIRDLPSIVSSPEEGFPVNLRSLEIHDMKIWKTLIQWGLYGFTSLRQLIINGCQDVVSLSSEGIGMALPASLNHLEIQNFQNLESLSSFGDNLTLLEFLGLSDCPKLRYFPENGLPSSLLKLSVNDCPLIEKKCRKDRGQYWPFIARIPCVKINWRLVFDDSTED